MFLRSIGIGIAILMVAGCASAPKMTSIQQHDPILDQKGGVVLLVDVCDQIDVVGDDDYFVVNESKEVAKALVKGIRTYLEQNGVQVLSAITPFVCGAFDTPENPPKKFADKAGGIVSEAPKPFGVADEIAHDAEYLNALTTLSTYIHERKMLDIVRYYAKQKRVKNGPQDTVPIINEDRFMEASNVVKAKTDASSILYVGLKGTKISGGKKFAQGLASFTVGMATGIATAGLGTGFWIAIMPGHSTDWKYSSAGLVNLESGKLVWSSWSSLQGNPLTPEAVAKPGDTNLLLKGLVLKDVPVETSSKE
jgi:hypothetical protein